MLSVNSFTSTRVLNSILFRAAFSEITLREESDFLHLDELIVADSADLPENFAAGEEWLEVKSLTQVTLLTRFSVSQKLG